MELNKFTVVREVLRNYWSHNLIGYYPFWIINPRNSTSFTELFLTGRHAWAGHETRYYGTQTMVADLVVLRGVVQSSLTSWMCSSLNSSKSVSSVLVICTMPGHLPRTLCLPSFNNHHTYATRRPLIHQVRKIVGLGISWDSEINYHQLQIG